jgi:hypothetical protein
MTFERTWDMQISSDALGFTLLRLVTLWWPDPVIRSGAIMLAAAAADAHPSSTIRPGSTHARPRVRSARHSKWE